MTTERQLLEQAREALAMAEDVLARSPYSDRMWEWLPEPRHPHTGVEMLRSALAAIDAHLSKPEAATQPVADTRMREIAERKRTVQMTNLLPVAYCIYIASAQNQYYVQELDEACDDLTNCECEVTPLTDHATATKYIAHLQAEVAALRDSTNRLQRAAEEIERALCAQVCIDLGRDDCAEAILARGKESALAAIDASSVRDMEADARRYQWLRGRLPGSAYRIAGVIYSDGGSEVDTAIDAAIAAEGKTHG